MTKKQLTMIVHFRRFRNVTATQSGTQIGIPASNGPISPLIKRNSSILNCGFICKIFFITNFEKKKFNLTVRFILQEK